MTNSRDTRDREINAIAEMRRRMVDDQLRRRGISDARVLAAMQQVPRHEFIPELLCEEAYGDWALPIGYGQTISQPFTVAYMLQSLELDGSENVLEIGTGSGYGAAVLSRISRIVHTVERIPELGRTAGLRLAKLGYHNVHVHVCNGTVGLPEHAPFDAVVITAGAEKLPPPIVEQLADGGRIVIPIGEPTSQVLYRFTKLDENLEAKRLGWFAFVPLIGKHGWSPSQANSP